MATITIRNLDDDVQRRLKRSAAEHNRSMEAEARAILTDALGDRDFGKAWIDAMAGLDGDELPIPPRSLPRDLDLFA